MVSLIIVELKSIDGLIGEKDKYSNHQMNMEHIAIDEKKAGRMFHKDHRPNHEHTHPL